MQRFGEKLRTIRTRRGMSLRQLADELGFNSHGYVGDLESGRKKPSLEVALKIARLFDVSVDSLVKDELEVE
jgi:putative transcriptional regulator